MFQKIDLAFEVLFTVCFFFLFYLYPLKMRFAYSKMLQPCMYIPPGDFLVLQVKPQVMLNVTTTSEQPLTFAKDRF